MSAFRLASLSSSGHGPRQPSRVIVSLIAAIVGRCAKLIAMDRIVVVGASLAGLWACESLRGGGYAGTITLVGAESHQPYDRPPLSKALLKGDWEPERIQLRKPDELDSLGLDLRLGVAAVALDAPNRTVTLAVGRDARRRRRDRRHRQRAATVAEPAGARRRDDAAHARRLAGSASAAWKLGRESS